MVISVWSGDGNDSLYQTLLGLGHLIQFLWVELDGRLLIAEFSRKDVTFRIAYICAPNHNPESDRFFTSYLDFVDISVPTTLCSDFNAVFD